MSQRAEVDRCVMRLTCPSNVHLASCPANTMVGQAAKLNALVDGLVDLRHCTRAEAIAAIENAMNREFPALARGGILVPRSSLTYRARAFLWVDRRLGGAIFTALDRWASTRRQRDRLPDA